MVNQGDSNIECGKTSENIYEEFIDEASKVAERTTMEGRIIEMQQEEGKVCRKKIEEERRKNII